MKTFFTPHARSVSTAAALFASALVAARESRADNDLALKAKQILTTSCYRCHGEPGKRVRGGFNSILKRNELVKDAKIAPGDAEKSFIIQRIHDKEMPPEGEEPRVSDEQLATLKEWINAGAPDWDKAPAVAPKTTSSAPLELKTPRVSDFDLFTLVARDLRQQHSGVRRSLRYFSFAHWKNFQKTPLDASVAKNALIKLLNYLSSNRRIVTPETIDTDELVFRVDIGELGWNAAQWDKVHRADPFQFRTQERELNEAAQNTVHADWFVATASRAPLYYDLLDIPLTDRELERRLRVNGAAARAGFTSSGVASHTNRVIERRHQINHNVEGAYWKSYDFSANTERGNIFAFPLGPGNGPLSFQQAGGEIIFNLPNGLQGYMLVNGKGDRLDIAPTSIVADPNRERGVEAGVSCLSCHAIGIIPKADQVRESAQLRESTFNQSTIEKIFALYVSDDDMKELMDEDNTVFHDAFSQLPKTDGNAGEPVNAMTRWFEDELSLDGVAAEVGLPTSTLTSAILSDSELSRQLGRLLATYSAKVKRDVFLAAIPRLTSFSADVAYTIDVRTRQALFESARRGDLRRLEQICALGISVDAQNMFGSTALMEAVAHHQTQVARYLIEQKHARRDLKDMQGHTVLDLAKAKGFEDLIKLLTK